MRYKGKRFYSQDELKNNSNEIDDDDVFVDVEDESDTFDVELKNSIDNDTQLNDVSQVTDKLSSSVETSHTLSLKERRKLVKKEKKIRVKKNKTENTQGIQSKMIDFESNAKKHRLIKDLRSDSINREKNDDLGNDSENSNIDLFSNKDNNSADNTHSQNLILTLKSNKKNIVLAVIIIFALVLSVLAFTNRDRLTFSNLKNWIEYGVFNKNGQEHFPVYTEGDTINDGNFTRINNNLVYASDTKFVTMNNYGRTIYSYQQSFSSPVLASAADSDLTLVYNLGGKEFAINTIDSTIFTGEVEDNILVADISKSGVYCIVTAKYGYLSKLYVFSKNNKQIYAYSFADFYITSVSLNDRGTSAVLTGVSAHDASKLSAVYLLDFNKEEPVLFEEITDNVLYHSQHLNNKYVCIIGENATYTLNTHSKEIKTTNYDGKTLTAFDVNTDTNNFVLSLSRNGDGRMCDILTFSSSGVLKNTISTDLSVSSLSTYKNRIAVLSNGAAYAYTKDGTMLCENEAGLDPHCIVLYSTTDAYVLGVSEIRRIDLR